jgi:acetyl esterase/lipase
MHARSPWLTPTILWICTLPIQAQQTGGTPFDRFDANKDGKLTRDELPERLRERFEAIDANKDGSISPEEQRAFLTGQRPAQPGAEVTMPPTVKLEKDIPYAGTKNPRQTLDLLLPRNPRGDKPLPLVVNIHGGAWQSGDKTNGVPQLANMVATGNYAAASIGYRLSGESTWPAQIHDCKAAIRWLRANAEKYRIDPDRIGVMGGSAGGHLVAMLGTSGGIADLEGDLGPYKGVSSRVKCVVDQFGPSDLLTIGDFPSSLNHKAPGSPESRLIGGTLPEHKETAKAASPITYISKDDPPFFIIHGDKDMTVPYNQSERLAKALKEAGLDVLFVKVEGGGHGNFRNPEVPKRIRQFFDKYLRDQAVGTISEESIPVGEAAPKS